MKQTLGSRLLTREITDPRRSYRKLYSDRDLISDIDIIDELDGHSGCVNALAWSKSGSLLASGSDDQHLNIHRYQPQDASAPFQLTTAVATGHTQNIFSVKFMPHQNDRIVVTAAGDGEVRIFDLEYAGEAREASAAASMASEGRRRGRNNLFNGVRYLSDGDTDSRVYRSHGDRVKRIVTESSPHLFLTCSEDGEVRQWDLRQPSSAYPAPRSSRFSNASEVPVPPPLISYKRFNLDLNTISCSASQPHYIALGGAHMHAFLHDRRMTGRDRAQESGKPASPVSSRSSPDDDSTSQATRCVRKFAPKGQQKMKRTENGHITACKISDARPDEMLVSWSGDHIYSFDLVRSPDAGEDAEPTASGDAQGSRVKKRKRLNRGSNASLGQAGAARASSRPRAESGEQSGGATLRVRYQNGQTEDISLPDPTPQSPPLSAAQKEARRIAKATVKIRSSLFAASGESADPTQQFTSALGYAASILQDMDQAMRDWRYPMDPSPEQVLYQQTLRRNRESARRLVQGAGTVSRVLGGKLRTPAGVSPMLSQFSSIEARTSDLDASRRERFGYDFLKAILLWLESGVGALIEGFTRPSDMLSGVRAARLLPIPEADASTEAIDDILIPYLLRLATDQPLENLEINRFEVDENRRLFPSEKAAVLAFAAAVRLPFADLSSAVVLAEGSERIQAQDRQTALRFWGNKVARAVLLSAAEGVNYAFVDRAYGGLGRVIAGVEEEEERMVGLGGAESDAVNSVEVVDQLGRQVDGAAADDIADVIRETRQLGERGEEAALQSDEEDVSSEGITDAEDEHDEDDDDDAADVLDDDEDDEVDDSSEPDEEDGVPNIGLPRFVYASAFERRRMRERVGHDVPCSGPIRSYRGHCNVRTVKDVNYFGPDDEYVVSGSDDGNFFMWDRKTSGLVGLWEGDGEVVNVIQGHPYETMLAVSGIDHTIKIFSPDARARERARLGNGVTAHDPSDFSSIAWPHRIGRRTGRRSTGRRSQGDDGVARPEAGATANPEDEARAAERAFADEEDDDYVAPTGLASRKRMQDAYRIMNQNDVERQGGNQDSYITVRNLHPWLLMMQRMGVLD